MAWLRVTAKLFKVLPAGASRSAWSPRAFVTAAPRPSQASSQKEASEQCEKATEAAEAVKEGAKEVRKTSKFVKDMAASTAESVTKITKGISEKVSETAENLTEKAKDVVQDKWGDSTKKIEDKVVEGIKDKVIGKS